MKTEKAFLLIFIIGLLFKLMHWPGAGPLIVVSLTIIAILYFPFAFYFFSDQVIKRQNLALSIVSGFFLSVIPIGLAFKLQYWPGAQVYLLFGLITAPVILAVIYYLKNKSPEGLIVYYKNMFKRTLFLSVLTTILYFTPTTMLLRIQHWDDPELGRLKAQYFANPDNEEYVQQYEKYLIQHSLGRDTYRNDRDTIQK